MTKNAVSSNTYGPSSRRRAARVTTLAAEELRGHARHEQIRHQRRRAGEMRDLVARLPAEADAVHDHEPGIAGAKIVRRAADRRRIVLLVRRQRGHVRVEPRGAPP